MLLVVNLPIIIINTVIASDVNELECQRLCVEERRQNLKKLEKHNRRSQ